jgi:hypothetical protein
MNVTISLCFRTPSSISDELRTLFRCLDAHFSRHLNTSRPPPLQVLDELERHSADHVGRPDHAVYASGGRVLAHSAAWHTPGFGGLLSQLKLGLHPQAQKVVTPSHGEPGHCLPLKVVDGTCGHVDIALRTSVIPEAVTLEHVSKVSRRQRGTLSRLACGKHRLVGL